jgi:hypothetical protein
MYKHPPPDRKHEVKMTRFECRLIFKYVMAIIQNLDIPPDIKSKIENALELALQDVMKK